MATAALAQRTLIPFCVAIACASNSNCTCDCEALCSQLVVQQRDEIVQSHTEIYALRHAASLAAAGEPSASARRGATSGQTLTCDESFIELRSNEEVELLQGCSALHTLRIYGDRVSSLAALSGLKTARAIKIIGQADWQDKLESLTGFENLNSLGDLAIENNSKLRSLSGLESLQTAGNITIHDNALLVNLTGLASLIEVGGNFKIQGPALVTVAGLENLASIGHLEVKWSEHLESLVGLESLRTLGGLNITAGDKSRGLCSLVGLSGVQRVEGDVHLSQVLLEDFHGLENLISVGGSFSIHDDLWPDSFRLFNKPGGIISFEGLWNLTTVGGDLLIWGGGSFRSFEGLHSLTHVGDRFQVVANTELRSLEGLRSLTHVGGEFLVFSNPELGSFEGLRSLMRVGGTLSVRNNSGLLSLEDLWSLTSVGGDLLVEGNNKLLSLESLWSLTSVGGDLVVQQNPKLLSLEGLRLVARVEGTLSVFQNQALRLLGLWSLASVGSVRIVDNPALGSLEGLGSLAMVGGGGVHISQNDELRSLKGLGNLQRVAGSVHIADNPTLTTLEGLEHLQHVEDLKITGRHRNLTSLFPGLQSLASVTERVIIETCRLASLHGLGALESAGKLEVKQGTDCRVPPPSFEEVLQLTEEELTERLRLVFSWDNRAMPMDVLGGPLAAHARVTTTVSFDKLAWPRCLTPHERMALASAHKGIPEQLNLPEARCERQLVLEPFNCTKGHGCSFSLGSFSINGEALGRVFVSGRTTGCGACTQSHSQSDVSHTGGVDFGLLTEEDAGLHSICLCGEQLGPVGQLLLRGPSQSVSFTTCLRGHSCKVKINAETLLRTDQVVLTERSCNEADYLVDFVADWIGDSLVLLHNSTRWATAQPGLYQVCWRTPCSLAADNLACMDKFFDAGEVELRGLYEENHTHVFGQRIAFSARNRGQGVLDKDRARLMHACGKANEDGIIPLEGVSDHRWFYFDNLTEDRIRAGSYRLCWCQENDQVSCTASRDFLADSGTVQILCSAGQEQHSESALCEECPAGRQQGTPQDKPCSLCSAGEFSPGGAAGCKPCPTGKVAELSGSSECVDCSVWDYAVDGRRCLPNPQALVLFASVALAVGASCAVLVRTARRRLSVVDVSLDQGRTIVTTFGSHGFSNFGRPSFPVTLRNTGHPGLDSPPQPLRVRVKDAMRLELVTAEGGSIKKRLDTSMGTLVVSFPHDFYHQGWPVPMVVTVPLLLMTVVALGGVAVVVTLELPALVAAVAAALVSTAASVATRLHIRSTPLARRLLEFKQALAEWHTICQASEKGPDRAIGLGKLHDLLGFFREFIRDRNAYFLTSNVLVPLTTEARLSYAEFTGPGRVEWFVSHFWGTAFEQFCTSLQKHAQSVCGTRDWRLLQYWVCFCSNNQHCIEEELGAGWHESSFYVTLRSGDCQGTCMVLDDKALPLTRIWCIFELMQTVKLGRSQQNFQGLLFCTSSGLLNTGNGSAEVAMNLAKRVADMDTASAEASNEHDERMIRDQVVQEMGSFAALNQFVCGEIRDMLVRARASTDEQFAGVLAYLDPALVNL